MRAHPRRSVHHGVEAIDVQVALLLVGGAERDPQAVHAGCVGAGEPEPSGQCPHCGGGGAGPGIPAGGDPLQGSFAYMPAQTSVREARLQQLGPAADAEVSYTEAARAAALPQRTMWARGAGGEYEGAGMVHATSPAVTSSLAPAGGPGWGWLRTGEER